jgi:hypothetical protein
MMEETSQALCQHEYYDDLIQEPIDLSLEEIKIEPKETNEQKIQKLKELIPFLRELKLRKDGLL